MQKVATMQLADKSNNTAVRAIPEVVDKLNEAVDALNQMHQELAATRGQVAELAKRVEALEALAAE